MKTDLLKGVPSGKGTIRRDITILHEGREVDLRRGTGVGVGTARGVSGRHWEKGLP